jgi:hypothetical protein
MTTAARRNLGPFVADVRSIAGLTLRAELRGDGADLFARAGAVRDLGARAGDRLVVQADHETVAGDVVSIDASGAIELRLTAPIDHRTRIVELRGARVGGTL